jgi:hypothetical protein
LNDSSIALKDIRLLIRKALIEECLKRK